MVENQYREFLIAHLINAAIKAGAAIMAIYNTPESLDVSLNDSHKPITAADRAAHNSLKESLGATRIPILSEEGRAIRYDERKNWELFWLIDPLDGTREFIDRNNEFTVNIALMSENKPLFGAIYVPYLRKLYFAERDAGAYVCYDLEPTSNPNISYSEFSVACESLPLIQPPHSALRVAISRSHNTPETYAHIDSLRGRHPELELIEQGSSYKFCLLAEGSVDYYVRTSVTSEWDTAAGEIILHEAGGETVAMESGEALSYNKEDLHNPHFVCRGVGGR